MSKHRNNYIRFKRAELEEYTKHPETCVKKIRRVESLSLAVNCVANFSDAILRILSKKIGKFDAHLDGVVLDFRRTKVLNSQCTVRNDSTAMVVNVEADFYIFQPRKDVIVKGIVKHVNRQSMETIISVIIYRVFNVKVTFKGKLANRSSMIDLDQEIQIRIKSFHFEDVIPYIEGELVDMSRRKINFDADSGIGEESVMSPPMRIKQEPADDGYEEQSRKRKRKDDETEIEQPPKRIKQEKISPPRVVVKQEKLSDDEQLDKTLDSPQKKKKKKDKKKKVDDFESSLLALFD